MKEIEKQTHFWDKEINTFDAIYSKEKPWFNTLLDSIFRWDMIGRFNYTMENSRPIEGLTFLDIGCGTGRYSLELALKKAKQVTGLDISQNMVDTCIKRAQELKVESGCRFILTDLLKYDEPGKFDISIGIGLFDYIKEPLPVLEKMHKYTAVKAIMSFPQKWSWRALVRKIRLGLKGCDVYYYTESEITSLLKKAGFNKLEMKKIGQLYCVTAWVKLDNA